MKNARPVGRAFLCVSICLTLALAPVGSAEQPTLSNPRSHTSDPV